MSAYNFRGKNEIIIPREKTSFVSIMCDTLVVNHNVKFNGPLTMAGGSQIVTDFGTRFAPSVVFDIAGGLNTGLYSPTAKAVGMSNNTIETVRFTQDETIINNRLNVGVITSINSFIDFDGKTLTNIALISDNPHISSVSSLQIVTIDDTITPLLTIPTQLDEVARVNLSVIYSNGDFAGGSLEYVIRTINNAGMLTFQLISCKSIQDFNGPAVQFITSGTNLNIIVGGGLHEIIKWFAVANIIKLI
jgi:hypothetical protein